jgi:hypothetical protein
LLLLFLAVADYCCWLLAVADYWFLLTTCLFAGYLLLLLLVLLDYLLTVFAVGTLEFWMALATVTFEHWFNL